jgi:hypothetical protein
MNALHKSADEIAALLRSDSASEELKQAVRLFSEVNVGQAMSDAETLEELFTRRFEACHEEFLVRSATNYPHNQAAIERVISEISNGRCDTATTRLIKAIDKLRIENVQPRLPGLELVALARALICVSVKMAGVDQGLKDAQYIFEAVLDDLAPMLREMPNLGS